ncbi:hypothetical protein HU200_049254 [Digitaria exilis]|uniref:Uncharacterized protein n=1 Tax=Digitaria exilis TaxID=1010633 RepID=A0A835AZR1_9POAL|nr:hypothetical protein HU200_049254 [Digitaria exilis]
MSFAGVSLVGDDGEASRSTWDATADSSDSWYHLFVVRGYSRTKETPNGKCINSQQFRVGGYRWHIGYYPSGLKANDKDHMSFYLRLDDHVVKDVTIQFELSFIDQVDRQEPSRIRDMKSCKIRHDCSWGYPCFIRRSVLEGSRHLKNDSFTVRCDIAVLATNANTERSSSTVPAPPPPSIQQHLSSLLVSGEGTDVTFEVGGETFMAHRCVLAARSPVFRAELFGPMKEGTTRNAISIDDMEPKVFRLLLSFIYSDSVPEINYDNGHGDDDGVMALWKKLLVAADIYDLQKLRMVCEENLCRCIEPTTVAGILSLPEQHSCQWLRNACLDFRNSLPPQGRNHDQDSVA